MDGHSATAAQHRSGANGVSVRKNEAMPDNGAVRQGDEQGRSLVGGNGSLNGSVSVPTRGNVRVEAPISGASVVPSSGTSRGQPSASESIPAHALARPPVRQEIAIVKHKSKTTKEVSAPQPVYLEDIDFASLVGVVTAADILVKQARTRVRVNRLKEGHAKGRHTEPDERGDQKRLDLTIRMMLGVRVSVGRQSNPLERREIEEADFGHVDKYTFPPSGATGKLATPSHKLNRTFKFRDYAPKVFKKLREHFGIEESSYTMSVAGNYDYLELITNSKSGSFFFFSHDQRYIIKAMKKAEAKFFRKILSQYYEHHLSHPDSLLIQFCGMYMVKNSKRKIPFIVMKCVEGDTDKEIHSKYDLKGSSLGRFAKEGEKVLKDNDLAEKYGKLHLGSQRKAFLQSARQDAEFLRSVNVIDYSMLVSIHDSTRPQEEEIARPGSMDRRYSQFLTFADEATNRRTPAFERLPASAEVEQEDEATDGRASDDAEDGGVTSEVNRAAGKDIYYLGVIDILQTYTTRKHAETFWKSLKYDRYSISCVDPKLYCDRFVDFLTEHTD